MDLLTDLNEPQRQAATHIEGPLLVVAGAGSGKTRVITRRVAHMIDQGIPPWNILAITFTNKAAGEMRERVDAIAAARGATVCTFHALCARLLREFATQAGLDGNYSIYDRDDQVRTVKQAMAAAELTTDKLSPTGVLATISNAKNDLLTPEGYESKAIDFYSRNVARVYREYQNLLARNNAMDFDDLLLRTATLLRDRPEIREFLGQRYRYVLIDEYQDTNRAQYLIAHGIAMDHGNVCATGDPDQSIYAWRGADIRNIMEFEKDYPDAVVVHLEENYRSSAPILGAASELISHNTNRKEKRLWTSREGGSNVFVRVFDDEHAEANAVGEGIAARARETGKYDDIAVFYRVNSQSRVLEDALMNRGIPYRIARGVEFYNRKEIRDVLGYLRLMVNEADDISCQRVINTPSRKIGATTVKKLQAYAGQHGCGLLGACKQGASVPGIAAATAKRVMEFASLIETLQAEIGDSVRQTIEQVVLRSGLENMHRFGTDDEGDAWSNIEELINTGKEFDDRQVEMLEEIASADPADAPTGLAAAIEPMETGLPGYLHQVSLVSDTDRLGEGGAVTLMTLHAAKGLEFSAVFLVGCEAGLLPLERADDVDGGAKAQQKLEEERRLAFVGITRAEDELTLSWAKRRMVRGRTLPQAPSPFLREIGQEGVTTEDHSHPMPAKRSGRSRGGFFDGGADSSDPVEDRAVIEAMHQSVYADPAPEDFDENPVPPEYEYLRVGSSVRHGKFGVGRVAKLSQPWPRTRVVIDFHTVGRKTLVLAMANLDLDG
jgi:DNA helicase II / ATP-dependent DNA helicase PcrA